MDQILEVRIMFSKTFVHNEKRVSLLKELIRKRGFVKVLEVHNGLSALIVDNFQLVEKGRTLSFDGLWESSLTDSASKGLPDIEVVSHDSRLDTINQILEVTGKPMIVDGDTGGDVNHFEYLVKRLIRAGVSMVIIEDKVFPKRNSLVDTKQSLEDQNIFAEKIRRGVQVKQKRAFMIVARLESLIAGETVADALRRAKIFLSAGADGIMIHSKSSTPSEILEFAKKYYQLPKKLIKNKVLVCAPTTYNTITADELAKAGFQVIIYANHMLRSAYTAMEKTCEIILLNDRSFEVNVVCGPVASLFEVTGLLAITQKENEQHDKSKQT